MKIFPEGIVTLAAELLDACADRHLRIATAESCTGGLVVASLTEIAGSSRVVDRGFVTYDNNAKIQMLGVSAQTLAAVGAVSAEVARAMAEGALSRSSADLAIAVTGIAGPGGGTDAKPIGLVHFAGQRKDGRSNAQGLVLEGGRTDIRLASVEIALKMLLELVGNPA